MNETVVAVASEVPNDCHETRCNKDGCRISLAGAPPMRVLVDMDCTTLPIPAAWKRCDYLFVGEYRDATWVAPIELKSGRLSSNEVLKQLEGGARMADRWLPQGVSFRLAPILAHGKTIHRNELKVLRAKTIQLRGQRRRTALIKCGNQLTKVFDT